MHEDEKHFAPGRWADRVRGDGHALYHNQSGGKGPDGKGDDRLVKNPRRLVSAMTAVFSQLTSLQSFEWSTPVFAVPAGVESRVCTIKAHDACGLAPHFSPREDRA